MSVNEDAAVERLNALRRVVTMTELMLDVSRARPDRLVEVTDMLFEDQVVRPLRAILAALEAES